MSTTYVSHAHCTHAATTEARRQCRRATTTDLELTVPSMGEEPPLRLRRLQGPWRDVYEMVDPRTGETVGTITKVDFLEEIRTRRGASKTRVTEYRMGFRANVDPARRFEGQGAKKITDALTMAARAYLELVAV